MLRQKKEFCGTNGTAAEVSMEVEGMAIGFAVCPPRSEEWALRATNVHKHHLRGFAKL